MVTRYVPRAGDFVWLDFDPQAGREQSKRRPALVITDQSYNRASGLAMVCPLTIRRKPYPFALHISFQGPSGASRQGAGLSRCSAWHPASMKSIPIDAGAH